ncbi:hypothetical protein M2651_10530 [Clostridium sp. SYSU_GA19001]|uniref:hypothetical protein n=1 Tax=Clostridium caldaquaticum TaxID=2940653 RepID=UPI0020775689|nr:hypothetical protein [Clostridium caldaquaticum]MCM8711456.1 hypothetical protein [Clostridium caldaquaticum]
MEVISFKVNMKTAYSDTALIKGGWIAEEKDKLYYKIKDKYRYNYIIKSFGKIRVSEIQCILNTEQKLSYEDMFEFNFEDAWRILWNKSFIPESLEILIEKNIFDRLVQNGWKPAVLGVIEYVENGNYLSYYYPAPEGENLYKIVDDNPGDVLKLLVKLKSLNIL